ncbi:MAG TPA: transglycosylase domain-containing protein, partial [Longimicrobiaceae bacterium]|nr:transglycosylase domain-containing protein [Longimicrobiaceae bacterium]
MLLRRTVTADETFAYDPARDDAVAPPRGRARTVLARVGKAVVKVLVGYYVLCLLLLVAYRFISPPVTGVQLQRGIEALAAGRSPVQRQNRVALTAMSRHLPRAVVAAEDGRYWTHWGFDLKEMWSAGENAVGGGRMRGASTITQQLMKNLFGCACRNPVRKLYDFALTPAAEVILGKHRILELYLNEVEWGDGAFGVDAAARKNYGVAAGRLTRSQSAALAALLPNPRRRTPANTGAYRR